MFDDLNEDNALIYAIKSYEGLNYVKSEFACEYRVFVYIKKLLQKYRKTGDLKQNLVLNHIIMMYNVFGQEAGTRLLFFKIDEQDYSALKTFLVYLHRMPEKVRGIDGLDIISSDIPIDMRLANILRSL
jgi:hypothetical protein